MSPQREELVAIRDHMVRRGPDGHGEWSSADGRVLLGHRRLSIIDLSDRAKQPMVSGDGVLAITFNGEIYNFKELKSELEAGGRRFSTTSDTEVLLALYEVHGPAMVEKLRGMFAFAIWDGARHGVFLARDPYGIKPLYYADAGGVVRFASQVKALLAGGHISEEPDPAGLIGFHLFGSVPEPFTMYQGISCLPAGSTLWIDERGAAEPRLYASLAAVLAAASGKTQRTTGQLEDQVREVLLDSVRHHLVADVEVGAFLSGGVDSGALLGLMRDAGQDRIQTMTLAFAEFRGRPDDEAPLAKRVAQYYGASHHTRIVDRREFEADLPAILQAMDQPSVDGVNTWFVSKAMRELGLKVAISGVGGDELLGGYSTFRDVPMWHAAFGGLAKASGLGRFTRTAASRLFPHLAKRNPKALSIIEYAGSYASTYLLKRAVRLPWELGEVLDADTIKVGLQRLDAVGLIERTISPDPGTASGRVTALESCNYMRNQLLRDADWASMAHSLEIRVPLVDFTVLQRLAGSISALKGATGKGALARAPSQPVPAEIVARQKVGFGVPTAAWMEDAMGSTVSNDRLASRRWGGRVLAPNLNAAPVLQGHS